MEGLLSIIGLSLSDLALHVQGIPSDPCITFHQRKVVAYLDPRARGEPHGLAPYFPERTCQLHRRFHLVGWW